MEISKLLPVNETLEFCLKQVDKSNLEELVPKIAAHLTGGGGVATKVGAAQFVTQLALRKKEEAAAGAPKLMVALRRGVINRSLPVRKAFAAALGQLARVRFCDLCTRSHRIHVSFLCSTRRLREYQTP
jgi:hypothetical protein